MRSSSPFEPGYANFARLCENISLNRCGDRVVPVPLRLADANGLVRLVYRSVEPVLVQVSLL